MDGSEESKEEEESMKLLDQLRLKRKKVDKRSAGFNDKVVALLMLYGIAPINSRACALEMVVATYAYNKKIAKQKHDAMEEQVTAFGNELLKIIAHNGVTDEELQDALLCQYFDYVNEAFGQPG